MQRLADFGSLFSNPFIKPENIKIPLPVRYPDGTRAIYLFNRDTKQYARSPGSSRDSNGNKIPETRSDVSGNEGVITYNFGDISEPNAQYDYSDMVRRIEMMGVPVIYPGGQGGRGAIYSMTCTSAVCTIWVQY